jgi:hypothetical protein
MRLRLLSLILTAMFLAVTFVHTQTAAAQPQPASDEVTKSETISVDYDEANAIITAFEAKNSGWRGPPSTWRQFRWLARAR